MLDYLPRLNAVFLDFLRADLYTKRKNLAPFLEIILAKKLKQNSKARTPNHSLQLTYLKKELNTFLAIDNFLEDDAAVAKATIHAYQSLKDFDQAKKLRRQRFTAIKSPYSCDDYYELQALHKQATGNNSKNPQSFRDTIVTIGDYNDRYFLLSKLQQASGLASYKSVRQSDTQSALLKEALNFLELHPTYLEDPLIALYYYSYRAQTFNEAEDRNRLFALLQQQQQLLESRNLRDLFISILNFSIRKMNTGEVGFAEYTLTLFKMGLDRSILYINDRLTGSTFSNIVTTALKLKEFIWVASFLEEYRDKLSPRDQRTMYPYCYSNYLYDSGKLGAAATAILDFEPGLASIALQINTRVTLIKIYYDQRSLQLLDNHLNNLSVFLSRHQEQGYFREIVLQFARLCRRLVAIADYPDREKFESLTRDIAELPVASYRQWLTERLPGSRRNNG